MVISSLPAFRLSNIQRTLIVAVGMCAVFLAVPSTAGLDSEAAENAAQQLRIKRLKPADPESTETMLADRGLAYPDRFQALSQGSA